MTESSLEIDYSSHRRRRRHHPPLLDLILTLGRLFLSPALTTCLTFQRHVDHPGTTPFASDSDTSWHGQLSWQFEPTGGWRDSRNLGAALSPWAAASATTNPSSRIFQQSANDYYLSNTSNAFHNFNNPYYEYSGYDALLPSGRLELQSYVARDHESSFVGRTRSSASTHHEHKKSPKFLSVAAIKEGGSSRNAGPQADTSLIDYDATNDLEPKNIGTDPNSHRPRHPLWLSASHAYRDDDTDQDEINYGVHDHHNHGHVSMHNHGGHGHHGMLHDQHDYSNHRDGVSYNSTHGHGGHYPMRHKTDDGLKSFDHGYGKYGHHSHDGRQSSSHQYRPGDHDGYDDIDRESGEDADEDDFGAPRSVGLFSLFKYSTNFDILLVILGCVGSFINGGSLPWYSLLFGKFVNKIARDSISNKDQMMKDVEKVSLHCIY